MLWKIVNNILCTPTDDSVNMNTGHTADDFRVYFEEKINKVLTLLRNNHGFVFDNNSLTESKFSCFDPCSAADIKNFILKAPTTTCSLDYLPTDIFKKYLHLFLPFLTELINISLSSGCFPSEFKHAIIRPRLKKESLDKNDITNYRPVSNLSFISKVVERIVAKQLLTYLTDNCLLPLNQSGYRQFYSTETALLEITSELFSSMDEQRVSLLALLDMSAAFDCVNHSLLLKKLSSNYGISNTVLSWFESYLLDRTQQTLFVDKLSKIYDVSYGVPQGSVLGPILFILYTSGVFKIIEKFGFKVYAYADDIQIIGTCSPFLFPDLIGRFTCCLSEVDSWMSGHSLKLNQCKTQFIPIGTWQQLSKLNINSININDKVLDFCPFVTNLGFTLDTHLMMNEHVKLLVSSCSFQLRRLRMIRRFLDRTTLETLVHAFINSRLDYCNSLFCGLSKKLMFQLQSIQNRDAKIVDGGLKYNHVTPILRKLHWLPVESRAVFKIAVLVYKCINGLAPKYLIDRCMSGVLVPINYSLRSSESNLLPVPSANLLVGSRNFSVVGPRIWNSLPNSLRQRGISFISFRKSLKTYLFE